jgi:hypothetical protein
VLAIEADGASYSGSGSVRDRDRLRGEHLQRLGWSFQRLWSTNWFQDPQAEVSKLQEAYRRAVAATDPEAARPAAPDPAPAAAPAAAAAAAPGHDLDIRPLSPVAGQPGSGPPSQVAAQPGSGPPSQAAAQPGSGPPSQAAAQPDSGPPSGVAGEPGDRPPQG